MARSLNLVPEKLLGRLICESAAAPIPGSVWYTAPAIGDGLAYTFPIGALADARYLTADILVDGNCLVVFQLALHEVETGLVITLIYSALNQCSARLRMPLEAVNQNRWRYEREGAWLKPMCNGDRVDLRKVDRMTITVLRKPESPARWCLTPVTATSEAPPRLTELLLPHGPLLDELGQSTLHEWPTKSRSP